MSVPRRNYDMRKIVEKINEISEDESEERLGVLK